MKLNQRNVQVLLTALGIDATESQRRSFLKRFEFSETNALWPIDAFARAIGGRAYHLLARKPSNYVKRERITVSFCAPEEHVKRSRDYETAASNWMLLVTISFRGCYQLFYWDAPRFDGSDKSLQEGEVKMVQVADPIDFEKEMYVIADRYGCTEWWEEIWSISLSKTTITEIRTHPNNIFSINKKYDSLRKPKNK